MSNKIVFNENDPELHIKLNKLYEFVQRNNPSTRKVTKTVKTVTSGSSIPSGSTVSTTAERQSLAFRAPIAATGRVTVLIPGTGMPNPNYEIIVCTLIMTDGTKQEDVVFYEDTTKLPTSFDIQAEGTGELLCVLIGSLS